MNRITTGRKVRNTKTGALGVTVDDFMTCCTPWETPVVYYGTDSFLGVPTEDLEDMGPENAIADYDRCGGGGGANCCIFLTMGSEGKFCCERHASLRYHLQFKRREMVAQRAPVSAYPDCQEEPLVKEKASVDA